jgi:hypothetical protein
MASLHFSLHPHLRHGDTARLYARHHAVRVTAFDHPIDGLDEQRVIELAGNAQRDGEVGRTDHHHVQAFQREQLVGAFHGAHGLELHHREGLTILMRNDLRHGARLVVDHRGIDAEAADSQRRKAQPAKRFLEQLGIFHARQDDALRALIQQTGAQRILHLADAHDGRDAGQLRGHDHVVHRLQVERAVLHIDEDIVEARRREGARNLRCPIHLQPAAVNHLASGEPFPSRIRAHEFYAILIPQPMTVR